MSRARGPVAIGIDLREDEVVIAVVRGGKRPHLSSLTRQRVPRTSDAGVYRSSDAIATTISETVRTYRASSPRISVSAARRSTHYSSADLPGLKRKQAEAVIHTQAARHFGNHADLHLAIAPALERRARAHAAKHRWIIAGTPRANTATLRDALKSLSAPLTHHESAATATLRTITGLAQHGTHVVLNGTPDGGDITITHDGAIELIRTYRGHDLERDILPELHRTLEYLRNQDRHDPHLHLASHHADRHRLQDAFELDDDHLHTPDLDTLLSSDDSISADERLASLTAIGLALGALGHHHAVPVLDLNHTPRKASGHPHSSTNPLNLIALSLLLAAVGYHTLTSLSTRALRDDVAALRHTVLSGAATPEQAIVDELQHQIDTLQRHQHAVNSLALQRTDTIADLHHLNHTITSSAHPDRAHATRYTQLSLDHEPTYDHTRPTNGSRITLQLISPTLLTLEHDLANLERDPRLSPSLHELSRVDPLDNGNPNVRATLEIDLHRDTPPEDTP